MKRLVLIIACLSCPTISGCAWMALLDAIIDDKSESTYERETRMFDENERAMGW